MKFTLLLVVMVFTIAVSAQDDSDDDYIRADRLGIAHISAYTEDTPPERYQRALEVGAGWNRFPIYWNVVHPDDTTWDWSLFDRQVINDLSYGLNINAILIGRPEFFADGNSLVGINEPVFSDGTDVPGEAKTLNRDNPWVDFVSRAVNRYKPGGDLAMMGLLPEDQGITVWEIWNEPDLETFWSAGFRTYARLLKISYLAAKHTDPNAQIMFGGLLYNTGVNWLAQVLNIYVNDPFAAQNDFYMDMVAVHSYADPWRSGWLVINVRQTLIAYGIDRPIWLNETGVPVWDDYPGPTWLPTAERRATLDQQAWFMIQSAAFAWLEGADTVIYHQLYDDCGDQPAGTTFPPHNGDLCVDDALCYGDAHGMFRNLESSVCFNQHPNPGSARPVAGAFRLLAEIFGREAFDSGDRVYTDTRATIITFERPRTNERITVMWNRTFDPFTLSYPAVGESGQLISLDGDTLIRPAPGGSYQIDLPAALPDNSDEPEAGASAAIGGAPYILIEQIGGDVVPVVLNITEAPEAPSRVFRVPESSLIPITPQIIPTATPTPTEVIPTQAIPTVVPPTASIPATPIAPGPDIQPPEATVFPLPETSGTTFTVTWSGTDDGGIEQYIIWMRVDSGRWEIWLETDVTSATFRGVSGSTYEFAAWAVDLAGNWSENIDLEPQATTQVQ